MPLATFDAAAGALGDWVVISGGFSSDWRVTSAVQLFHRRSGWRPISTYLWDARARHTQTTLNDGRVLIAGGVEGALLDGPANLRPLDTAEFLHPTQARGTLVRLDQPLVGHTATPLPDGRIALVGGAAIRILDPRFDALVEVIPLRHPRQGHTTVLLEGSWREGPWHDGSSEARLLVIGGDDGGSIEEIDLSLRRSYVWDVCLDAPLVDTAAVSIDGTRVWVTGGYDAKTQRTTDATAWLDTDTGTIAEGPSLQLPGGVAGHVLAHDPDGRRLHLVGGETREPGRVRAADSGRVVDLDPFRLWTVYAPQNEFVRRAWFLLEADGFAAAGGYRFMTDEEAAELGVHAGPTFVAEIDELRVPPIALVAD